MGKYEIVYNIQLKLLKMNYTHIHKNIQFKYIKIAGDGIMEIFMFSIIVFLIFSNGSKWFFLITKKKLSQWPYKSPSIRPKYSSH